MSTIITRNSATSGSVPASLVQGELAINVTDGRLFYGSGSGNTVKEFTASGSGTTNTGSLLTTASFSNPNLTFTKGDGSTFNVNLTSLVPTSASYALSSSHALTASFITASGVYGPYGSNSVISSSYAVSSSHAIYADTASSATNAQDILIRVLNQSGNPIAKGIVVHITASGTSSDIPRVITASYENDNNSANTLGITNETIANGAEGFVMTEGVLKGIDTSAFQSGQLIYLGATGSIIGTAPVAPLHNVRLGQVVRQQLNNGSIYVRIDNGYELEELHDILITSASSGDLLVKDGAVWYNTKQLTGSYGLTGSLEATGSLGITGSLSVLQSLDSQNRYLIDSSNVNSIEWGGRLAKDSLNTPVIDWDNQQLFQGSSGVLSADWSSHILYDTTATQSVDWNNRYLYKSDGSTFTVDWESQVLYDGIGNSSIDWSSRVLSTPSSFAFTWNAPSNLYVLGASYPISTFFSQIEDFAAQSGSNFGGGLLQNLAGEVIPVAGLVDAGVSTGNLVYLNTDGVWYKTNQFSISSSYMLGICVSNNSGKERVFIEGTIGFATSSIADMPYVSGSNFYGTPIYISGSNGAMSTQKPTSGIVRVVGHAFYNSTTTPTNWLMKFRPSNDWYEI